jgi:two-component SAPR family response regulator
MLVQEATKVSLESFRQRSSGKKVILLYPWTNYRTLFLTHFLESAREGLLYYRITNEQTTLKNFLEGLVQEFNAVLGNFGSNLQRAISGDSPSALGEALAADLNAYSKGQTVLFVDELDRVPMDEHFNQFITALVNNIKSGVQVAFSSRLLMYQPWYNMVERGEAVVLGIEYRKDDVMFTIEEKPKPQLEVYAFGRGHALVNGQPITNWDGALPRNLFFFFLDHLLVTRDEIFQTFWPDLNVKEATNVFHVTKRKITERISMKVVEGGNYELTQYNSGFYLPSDKVVRHYDVGDFQSAVERAIIASNEKEELALYLQAIDLYRAPFLQTVEMPWVQDRREHLRQLNSQSLIGVGRIWKRRQNDQQALGFFTRALKEVPEREDIHREVMAIYLRLGMVEDARRQYRRLEQVLDETLNIGPSRESRELYAMIEAQG